MRCRCRWLTGLSILFALALLTLGSGAMPVSRRPVGPGEVMRPYRERHRSPCLGRARKRWRHVRICGVYPMREIHAGGVGPIMAAITTVRGMQGVTHAARVVLPVAAGAAI